MLLSPAATLPMNVLCVIVNPENDADEPMVHADHFLFGVSSAFYFPAEASFAVSAKMTSLLLEHLMLSGFHKGKKLLPL